MLSETITAFGERLTEYYRQYGRYDMLWRQPDSGGGFDPYKIMVSELMLQQTQVSRVTPKYREFIRLFPTVQDLAGASLADVLTVWSGLGYNRRAKFLWQAAQTVVNQYHGLFPSIRSELQKLPGIGPNTAGAIMAYAFDAPALFVETNIRTVIIHHFFDDHNEIADQDILKILDIVLPAVVAGRDVISTNREFYWALMDYGAYLKKTVGNKNRLSKTYAKQATFHGSKRQIRGQVLRRLTERPSTLAQLRRDIADERLQQIINDLAAEGLIRITGRTLRLG